jgi:DNA-directed RNA polymerase specialized sigma24 family protein
VDSGPVAASRSRDEIADAIRGLTSVQWARLRLVAARRAFGRPVEAEDLLQMALASALDGRTCPAHVDVVRFLAEAMRSIGDGEVDKARRRPILVPVPKTGENRDEEVEFPDDRPTVEEQRISDEDRYEKRAPILTLFDDDATARDLVEGVMENMTAAELRELTGLDEIAYASKRRLIRRRINAAFRKGLKP